MRTLPLEELSAVAVRFGPFHPKACNLNLEHRRPERPNQVCVIFLEPVSKTENSNLKN